MALDKDHLICTTKDGRLDETGENDIRSMLDKAVEHDHIVIHIHGGLVKQIRALEKATRLIPEYQAANTYPIFFIWESGLFESLKNFEEIFDEPVFKKLLEKLVKWTVGKITETGAARATGQLILPRDLEVKKEINKTKQETIPYEHVKAAAGLTELSDDQLAEFEKELMANDELKQDVREITDNVGEESVQTSKGIAVRRQTSRKSLMSPEVVEELQRDTDGEKAVGGVSAKFFLKAGKILYRVIKRFVNNRDHGVYTTVVEELLHEFYLANVGSAIWSFMKNDTRDTFIRDDSAAGTRGGWFFLQELGARLAAGQKPRVSLVGHSTGAIFICHMLNFTNLARKNPSHPMPLDFSFENIIFLAPAVDFNLFNQTLDANHDLIGRFRMFALKDELETGYWEVPLLYDKSLLYMVSGLFEKTTEGDSATDLPIVGMQRYFEMKSVYTEDSVKQVRAFIEEKGTGRVVWSVSTGAGPGLNSDSVKHGGFDSTDEKSETMKSVKEMLRC